MAAKKQAKKPLAKKAMKKTKGGAAYMKVEGVDGETRSAGDVVPTDQFSLNFSKVVF